MTAHIEDVDLTLSSAGERIPEAQDRSLDTLPKGYFYSPYFLGTFFACGFSFMSAVGGYVMPAALLPIINADIGPSNDLPWIALGYQLSSCVIFLLVGRLSDVFGRRWFFITGSLFGTLGAILGSTATSINMLIAAEVFLGIATGFQLSSFWVLSEIVPQKSRFMAVSTCYIFAVPTGPLGAKVALSIENETSLGWRGAFYIQIAINGLSTLCWFLFYHPPTFKMLHRRTSVKDLLRNFDWIGLVLFTGTLFIFLTGLTWGGAVYPWTSGRVIGTIVGGAVGFGLFILWEIWLPVGSEPYLPLVFFRNWRFQVIAWLSAIGSAVYYAFALIWPSAVPILYSDRSLSYQATLSSLTFMGIAIGQVCGGFLERFTGPRLGCIIFLRIGVPILAAAAYNPLNLTLTAPLVLVGCFFVGMVETIAVTALTLPIKSQADIGTAAGLGSTIRQFGAVIATAILSTILSTRLRETIPKNVVPAATGAGLPASSIPALLLALSGAGPSNEAAVPGLDPQILQVATRAFQVANAQAYRTVFLSNLAFGGIGLVLVFFVIKNNPNPPEQVAGVLTKADGPIERVSESKV